MRRESDIPPEPTCLRHSDAASAFKGGEAVPVGDWSEAQTLERIASEVAIFLHGSGRILFFSFFIPNLNFYLLSARTGCVSTRSVVHNPLCVNYRDITTGKRTTGGVGKRRVEAGLWAFRYLNIRGFEVVRYLNIRKMGT